MMEYLNDAITQAYKDGYQRGIEENKKNNNKLRNLQMAILADAKSKKEKVIAVDKKTFEEIKGKEIKIRLTTEILEAMEEEIK